jgi:hypothetical protein
MKCEPSPLPHPAYHLKRRQLGEASGQRQIQYGAISLRPEAVSHQNQPISTLDNSAIKDQKTRDNA